MKCSCRPTGGSVVARPQRGGVTAKRACVFVYLLTRALYFFVSLLLIWGRL